MRNSLLFTAALCFVAAGTLLGQTGRGSLTGTVTDPTGSSVPGAAISATHAGTGTAFRAETSSGGVFTLPELPFGQYTVAVTKAGFQTAESSNVTISANQVTRFDLTLSVGNVQQAVQVEAVAPLLQQDSSTVQTNFTTKQVLELPLSLGAFGLRSAEAFTFLTPGVVGDQFLTSINGGQTFSNEVLIDGGSAGRGWAPGNADESAPSVDAIGEFTIKTNNFSAEYGHTGSAITSFVLKSGTNNYHGTAYEFLRNEAFNAFGFYRQANYDRKHDFGGTLGGPVWIPKIYNGRDRTFFFFSYEHTRADEKFLGSPRVVPTAAQRQGDFSELLRLQNPTIIHDPLTGLPFEGNRIPQNRISPVSQYALQFIPAANDVDPATGLQRLYYQPQPTFRRTFLSTAVFDHNITTNHRFHHSWSRRENIRHRDPGNLIPQDNPLTEMRFQNYNTNQWRASLDSTLRPNLLNHLNLSADRVRSTNGTLTSGMNFVQQSGLTGVQNTHTPVQDIAGYMTLGNAELNQAMETRFEIAENLTWVTGAHTLKMGADIRRSFWNLAPADRSAGIFRFRAAQTSSLAGAGGDAFASYLLGSVQSAQVKLNTMYPGWIYPYYAFFVQDDWKATRRLTLNLGLRYDINVPRHERTGRYSGLNPSIPNPAAGGIPGALEFLPEDGAHFDKTHHGFAPRLGMTFALDDKTIIQTGYGIAYMQWYYNDFAERMTAGFDAEPIRESPSREQAFNWSNGFPQDFARPPFSDPSSLNRDTIDYLDPNAKPPYMQNWNFGVQRQVARDLVVNVAYVGTKGTRLYSRFEVNRLHPNNLYLGDLLTRRIDDPAVVSAGFSAPYPTFIQDWGSQATLARALRRFPQYNGLRFYNPTVGDSSYHSLQVKVDKRFSAGLQFLATYTFAKHLTNADAANRNDSTNYQNDYALGLEKSVSGSDRPHVFNLSYIYELPFGRGKRFMGSAPGVVNALLGGWQLSGAHRYASGVPLSPSARCPSLEFVNASARCRPDYTGVPELYGPGKDDIDPSSSAPYVNPAAFTVPAPYTFGNVERNVSRLRTMPSLNENVGLFKNFDFGERARFQFRAEAFNVLNRVIFSAPDMFVGTYNASQPGNIERNPRFGFFVGQSNTPRVLQLGAKIIF